MQYSDHKQAHSEALALVSVHRTTGASSPETGTPAVEQGKTRDDLCRAKELVQLHYEMKSRHANGQVDEDLQRAREDVLRVLGELP